MKMFQARIPHDVELLVHSGGGLPRIFGLGQWIMDNVNVNVQY
jgi:hypothetical protein